MRTMNKNTPYLSTSDTEYDRHLSMGLSEQEKSILQLLKQTEKLNNERTNLARLARELRCSYGAVRSSLHKLEADGLIQRDEEQHYKLTRAGKRQ